MTTGKRLLATGRLRPGQTATESWLETLREERDAHVKRAERHQAEAEEELRMAMRVSREIRELQKELERERADD